mmetsp:Transcript_57373/g.118709  ORF Transcript_57373/g.118709 Transcript_57373/m.118709 type:complete len:248 (-) Transcript_57373:17-760(-)
MCLGVAEIESATAATVQVPRAVKPGSSRRSRLTDSGLEEILVSAATASADAPNRAASWSCAESRLLTPHRRCHDGPRLAMRSVKAIRNMRSGSSCFQSCPLPEGHHGLRDGCRRWRTRRLTWALAVQSAKPQTIRRNPRFARAPPCPRARQMTRWTWRASVTCSSNGHELSRRALRRSPWKGLSSSSTRARMCTADAPSLFDSGFSEIRVNDGARTSRVPPHISCCRSAPGSHSGLCQSMRTLCLKP